MNSLIFFPLYEGPLEVEKEDVRGIESKKLKKNLGAKVGIYKKIKSIPCESLDDEYDEKELKNNDFFLIDLELSIDVIDPSKWRIAWTKIGFHFQKSIEILSYRPGKEGLNLEVKKTQDKSNKFKISGEIGVNSLARIEANLKRRFKQDYEIKYRSFIENIIGHIVETENNKSLYWTIYCDDEIALSEDKLQRVVISHNSFILKVPKNEKTSVKITVDGRVYKQKMSIIPWFTEGVFDLLGNEKFDIQP